MATYIISGAFFETEKRIYDREAKQFAKAKSSMEGDRGHLEPVLAKTPNFRLGNQSMD